MTSGLVREKIFAQIGHWKKKLRVRSINTLEPGPRSITQEQFVLYGFFPMVRKAVEIDTEQRRQRSAPKLGITIFPSLPL